MNRKWPFLPLRIGTRGSPLALAQTPELCRRLMERYSLEEDSFETVAIATTGDAVRDRPLHEIGGKGLFVAEIDRALLAGEIDVAVHSLKDRPSGGRKACGRSVSFRAETCGTLSCRSSAGPSGTCRPGRESGPAARVGAVRSSVGGRTFASSTSGETSEHASRNFETARRMRPSWRSPASIASARRRLQPAFSIRTTCSLRSRREQSAFDAREESEDVAHFLAAVCDRETALRVKAERAFLERIGGSCRSAVAGLADMHGGRLRLRGEILSTTDPYAYALRRRTSGRAASLGRSLADELRRRPGAAACVPGGREA